MLSNDKRLVLLFTYAVIIGDLASAEPHSIIEELQLSPSSAFEPADAACTQKHGIRALISAEILPQSSLPWAITLSVHNISSDGHVLHAGPLSVVRDGASIAFSSIGTPQANTLIHTLSQDHVQLMISHHGQSRYLFCVNGAEVLSPDDSPVSLVRASLANGIILGDPRGTASVLAVFKSLSVSPLAALSCHMQNITVAHVHAATPEIDFPGMPASTEVFINDNVSLGVTALCPDYTCKLRVTAYGVPPEACNQPECGNVYTVRLSICNFVSPAKKQTGSLQFKVVCLHQCDCAGGSRESECGSSPPSSVHTGWSLRDQGWSHSHGGNGDIPRSCRHCAEIGGYD